MNIWCARIWVGTSLGENFDVLSGSMKGTPLQFTILLARPASCSTEPPPRNLLSPTTLAETITQGFNKEKEKKSSGLFRCTQVHNGMKILDRIGTSTLLGTSTVTNAECPSSESLPSYED